MWEFFKEKNIYKEKLFIIYMFFIIEIFFLFSPLISLMISFFLLTFFSEKLSSLNRYIIVIILIFSYSLVISSMKPTCDFIDYYKIYKQIYNNNLDALFNFGGGLEIGLTSYFYFLAHVFNIYNEKYILFFLSLTILFLFYIWLEKFPLKLIDNKYKALAVSLAILYFNVELSLHLIRQMFSGVFLLYAISYENKKKYFFLFIAIVFHLSAFFLFIIISLVNRFGKIILIIIFFITYLIVNKFQTIYINLQQYSFLVGGNNNIIEKLNPVFERMNGIVTKVDLSILKYIIVVLLFYFFISFFKRNNLFVKKYEGIVFLLGGLYFLLFPLPLMPYRVTLLLHAIILGVLFFPLLQLFKNNFYVISFIKLFLLFIMLKRYISYIFIDNNSAFQLWYFYDWFGLWNYLN